MLNAKYMKGDVMLRVVGALIKKDGRYLVCQRRPDDAFGGKWEFPGGKVESGEADETALRRELAEELGVEAVVGERIGVFEDTCRGRTFAFHLYACAIHAGTPRCLECSDIRMVTLDDLARLDLTPVDRKAVAALAARLAAGALS